MINSLNFNANEIFINNFIMDQYNPTHGNRPHPHQISEELIYYMNRQKQLLIELERKQIDAVNLKDLALAYEDLEAERNNLQAELEQLSRHMHPRGMGESTEREVYEKKIYDILHQLNIKSKECAEFEIECKHLQEENISLSETIQHYEEFSNSLRIDMRALKSTVDERNEEIISLKQELVFQRERGTVDHSEEKIHLAIKFHEMIDQKDMQINELKTRISELQQNNAKSIEEATFDLTLNELKGKEAIIQNLEKRLEYLTEQNRVNSMSLETKNQDIFRLKKQILESENKSVSNLEGQGGFLVKPRSVIDQSLSQQLEGLKNLRPELEQTKDLIRRKEMELLEIRQSKEAQVLKLANQIEELQIKLSSSNNKLEEQRLLYRQWKLTNENRAIKDSMRPASSTISIVQTYEKQVNDLYAKLQQSRQDYIQMRKTSQQKSIQLEVRIGELVFKINQINGLLYNHSQEKQLMIKENKTLRMVINNLKAGNDQHSKTANEFNRGTLPEKSNVNSKGRLETLNAENLTVNNYNTHNAIQRSNDIRLENENRQLRRMLENREIQISHLEAAVTEINSALIDCKAQYHQLERRALHEDISGNHILQQEINQLRAQNSRLSEQKQLIVNEITKTQSTINQLTVKLSKLQYYNSQHEQIWENIDMLYVSANKLGVLVMMLRDNQGGRQEDTIRKLVAIAEKIKNDVDHTLEIRERISRVQE